MEPPLSYVLFAFAILVCKVFFLLCDSAILRSRKTWLLIQGIEDPVRLSSRFRCLLTAADMCIGAAGAFLIMSLNVAILELCVVIVVIAASSLLAGTIGSSIIARWTPEKIVRVFLPFIKLFRDRVTPQAVNPETTHDEFRIALMEGERSGTFEKKERDMVEGVFYLGDREAGTFMTHRSEIQWLDINADADEAKHVAVEYQHQRYFPVAHGTLDSVVGIVSTYDILCTLADQKWQGLAQLMKAPCFVPETMSALKAFEAFKQEDADFLVVMDEYGGFAGVLSVQNLVERIVGELSIPAQEAIVRQENGSFLVDGTLNIDALAVGLNIESLGGEHRNYHTVAGFILELSGEIPQTGNYFDYGGYRWTIVDMDGNRIDKLLIAPLEREN